MSLCLCDVYLQLWRPLVKSGHWCLARGHSLLFGMCLKFDRENREVTCLAFFLIVGKTHWQFSAHKNVNGEARSVIYMQMSKG